MSGSTARSTSVGKSLIIAGSGKIVMKTTIKSWLSTCAQISNNLVLRLLAAQTTQTTITNRDRMITVDSRESVLMDEDLS